MEWALIEPILFGKKISSIYFGGGTPALFKPHRIASLLKMIQGSCELSSDVEITLEANPENIDLQSMKEYAAAGINRASIGIQTLDPALLQLLGRLHHSNTALKAVETTFQAGIENISIDLMYDLPHQTLKQWTNTLHLIKQLPISHLSLYNLTIEPHTLFFKNEKALQPHLPSQEMSLAMIENAREELENMGLKRYEISAFSKPGKESRHNSGYWTGRQFLGFGPSAFSYWENKRFRNIAHLGKYCESLKLGQLPRDFEEELDPEAHRRELLVIRLRLMEGVDIDHFTKEYGELDPQTKDSIKRLIHDGFLTKNNHRLQLSEKGILFYDTIAVELI